MWTCSSCSISVCHVSFAACVVYYFSDSLLTTLYKVQLLCNISTIRIRKIHSSLCDILPRFAEFLHCVNKDKNKIINLEIFSLETKENCQFIYNCNAKSKLSPIAICNVTLTVCSPLIVLSCVAKKFSNFSNTSNLLPPPWIADNTNRTLKVKVGLLEFGLSLLKWAPLVSTR